MISLSGAKAFFIGGFFLSLSIFFVVFFSPNTDFERDFYDLEVKNPLKANALIKQLNDQQVIRNTIFIRMAAWTLSNNDTISNGLFQLQKGWSNWDIINYLKTDPKPSVEIVIKPFQQRHNTLQYLCKYLEIKHTALKSWLEDETYLQQWENFNRHNVYCVLIPDTILVYRDSRAKEIADRLFRNYLTFWNAARLEQAAKLGLTPNEVGVLASIVYAETKIPEEMPTVARLYMNRLQKNMRLQADPTVVFASGKSITRVLKVHKKIKSEYNTYRVYGFPPGPVFTPTKQAVDAVLSAETHDYLYFCAKNDFSGYHHFSRTFDEHLQVARTYHKETKSKENRLQWFMKFLRSIIPQALLIIQACTGQN